MKKNFIWGIAAVLCLLQIVSIQKMIDLDREIERLQNNLSVEEDKVEALQMDVRLLGIQPDTTLAPEKCILKMNNRLFYGTGEAGVTGDSGCIGGMITYNVTEGEIPTENGSSNFGCVGNLYTRDDGSDTIMVMIGGEWYIFKAQSNQ